MNWTTRCTKTHIANNANTTNTPDTTNDNYDTATVANRHINTNAKTRITKNHYHCNMIVSSNTNDNNVNTNDNTHTHNSKNSFIQTTTPNTSNDDNII